MLFFYHQKGKQGSAQQCQEKQYLLTRRFVVVQQRLAQYLARKTKNYSERTLRVVTVLFVLICSSFSVWVAINSFDKKAELLSLTEASPMVLHHPAHNDNDNIGFAEKDFTTLQWFIGYLDSLQKLPTGESPYNRLVQDRLGLIDSIKMLQTIHLQQKKGLDYERK